MTVTRAFGIIAVPILFAGCATAPPLIAPPPQPPAPPTISFETKMSWILRLEDRRIIREATPPVEASTPVASGVGRVPPPEPDLLKLLEDGEARVRRRAALGLGRVGLPDAVPGLSQVLAADPEAEVRQMSAFALGLIGDRTAVDVLRSALADTSPIVQGRAAEALGLIGDEGSASAIGEMIAAHIRAGALTSIAPDDLTYPLAPPVEATRLGLYALVRLKGYDALARAVHDDKGQPLVRWWPVAFALQRLGDKRAIPALRTLAGSETTYTRAFAIQGLGELDDQNAAAAVMPLISSAPSNPMVGVEAIRTAGRLRASKAGPLLAQLAFRADVSPMLRAEAVQALGATGAGDAQEALLDLVSDKSPLVRAAVIAALARLEPDTFVTVLSSLEPDSQWNVRAALATVLGTLPRDAAARRLEAILSDSDLRVIPAVLASLTKIRAANVESVLLERLKHDDAVVRVAAATNLGELKPAGAAEALIAAYNFGQRDASYGARAAALGALSKYGAAAATDTLKAALMDKDWAVRIRAAELLKSLDPSAEVADAIRPAPNQRPAPPSYDDQRLIVPTVSPHVFIDTDKGTIEIEMNVIDAPQTADNFMMLARKGFFEGVAFHRIVPNFVVQAGDPRGDGEGGPGYTIRDEINEEPYLRGTVGMALDWRDTGGSQFFITHSPHPHLDARYTVFGHVVSGMEVVDHLEQGDVIRRMRVWDGVQATR
jgi:cyclophilin family peptidyl-prolyl cis-trans isomerase/HEAT repeat protein